MRAWLFVIAVLATLQLIIQVASTEELSSSSTIDKSYKMSENNDIINSNSKTKPTSHSSNNNQNSHSNSENNLNNLDNSLDSENQSFSTTTTEKPDPATLIEIEKNLLSIFGFKKRPKIDRSKIIIPQAMKNLYAEIMGHELNTVNLPKPGLHTKSANTVRSFNHEDSKIDSRFLHHHRFRLFFNVSSIPKNEKLKAAELNLSRNPIANQRNMRHHILVYDILRPGIKNKREPIFLLIDSKQIRINESGIVSLDVLPAVDRWLNEPKKNYGILIHISSGRQINNDVPEHRHIRLKRSLDDDNEMWTNHQPLLLTYTDDGRFKPRNIRDTIHHSNNHHHHNNNNHNSNSNSSSSNSNSNSKTHNHHNNNANRPRRASKKYRRKEICQRRPLYVDFQDVGWSDWIVAPPGYEAYYCQGDCSFPLADHLNSTNHAVVQTLVNSINPAMAPKACCVPTHLTSMTMLYLNDINKVVLKNYPEMTVVGCGCR